MMLIYSLLVEVVLMYYMNKTKRGLILTSAILNLILITFDLIVSIIFAVDKDLIINFVSNYMVYVSVPIYNLGYSIFSFVVGVIGSVLLIYSVRQKGKYFRSSQAIYAAGFVIIVICGGYLAWALLFIAAFIPDIIVMNRPSEVKREEAQENRAYAEKKQKIEALKKMRDDGLISDEEYKEKLFELL